MKTFSITFALGAVVLFASNVAAHGRFLSPATRIADGDENQGFTQTRSPTTQEPCAGVPFQGVKTQLSPGQTFPYSWEIGAAHRGTCFLELSTDGAKTFQTIKEDPHCADSDGTFNSEATLPAGVTGDQCVIRWRWQALLTGELYINCADVSIGGSGGGTTSGDAGSGGTTSGDAGSGGTTSGSTGSDGTGSDGTGSGGTTSGSTGSDGAGSGAPTVQMPSTGDPSNPSTDPSNPSTDPSNPSTDPSNPSTGDPSTDPSNPSTADPSTTAADPSTTDPSTADPSTADPSTGGDPGCEMQPGQDGGESPSTDDPQQPPADSNTGNTSANSGAKRFRRSAQRAGPRRLRRSA